jgi:predicted RNA-binding Zn-ribbon protein involved in translation (DUF1610 family)
LCAPTDKQYVCDFCGAEATDPRHICFPKLEKIQYVCGTCGRVAVSRSHLCTPRTIAKAPAAKSLKAAKPKKGAKGKKRTAAKSGKKKAKR